MSDLGDIRICIEYSGERPPDELVQKAADHARAILEEDGHEVIAAYELTP